MTEVKTATRRTSMAIAAVAAAGVSTLFAGAAPANALGPCGPTGNLVTAGICEQTFTSGSVSFTPTASMTKLEVLLVGAGGSGSNQPASNTNGYASAGGGGGVTITDFSGATVPLTGTVPAPGSPGSVTDGTTTTTPALNGLDGAGNGNGGASGNGNAGAVATIGTPSVPYGGGGGAGAAAVTPTTAGVNANGGAGVTISSIAPAGSLFTGDATCYGGGGAAGVAGVAGVTNTKGTPGCGGGGPADATATSLSLPTANRGGGGGGVNKTSAAIAAQRAGAGGAVVIRWTAAPTVVLTFDANGHGTAPASQDVQPGTAPTKPADPAATDYLFGGWYADEALTTPADFSAPLTAATTFFAKWTPELAATGAIVDPAVPGAALLAVMVGIGVVTLARRRRQAD